LDELTTSNACFAERRRHVPRRYRQYGLDCTFPASQNDAARRMGQLSFDRNPWATALAAPAFIGKMHKGRGPFTTAPDGITVCPPVADGIPTPEPFTRASGKFIVTPVAPMLTT
jgi:hypothetical protein